MMKLVKERNYFIEIFIVLCLLLQASLSYATPTALRAKATEVGSTAGTRIQVQDALEIVADIFDDGTNDLDINDLACVDVTASTVTVNTETFGSGWNSDNTVPTKDSLYDAFLTGTYLPGFTHDTNIQSSTSYTTHYFRHGDLVHVAGKIDFDPTATGWIQIDISLPIASNFTAQENCTGVLSVVSGSFSASYGIRADATNDRCEVVGIASYSTNHGHFYTFTYRIL